MHKDLIIDAFEKSKEECIKQGIHTPSKRQISMRLSEYLVDDFGFAFGDKSLRNYYDKAVAVDAAEDISITQPKVIEGLCQYLGFKNYQEYLLHRTTASGLIETDTSKPIRSPRPKKVLIIGSISFVLIVGAFLIFNATQQRWMLWNSDHYEEVSFDQELLGNGTLKLYKEDRILHFKKVDSATCDYEFFNADGSVKIWYGKNRQGDLEFFTDVGLHPETGKTLRPITPYMIRKYVCDSI